MKTLSIAGTAAMFLVGGGIIVHGIGPLHHAFEAIAAGVGGDETISRLIQSLIGLLLEGCTGIAAGGVILLLVTAYQKVFIRPAS